MNAYIIIRTFGIVILLAAGFVQCSKIHERMIDDGTDNIFRTTRDKMSELEVIPLQHNRYKQPDENARRNFTDYGKTIDAYLKTTDGQLIGANTPVWLAFTKSDGTVEYRKMREGIVGMAVSRFLELHRNSSPVAVNQEKDKKPSSDDIVDALHFPSSPKRFRKASRMRRNSEDPNASRIVLDAHDHMIIKSTSVTEEEKIRRLEKQIREASQSDNRTDASRVKRTDKEIIYPSLLVQTYYKGAKTRPDDLDYTEEIVYQLAFWNAVDLRLRQASDPEIRLHISGIIIGLDPNAIPYLGSDEVDANKIWDETKKYWNTMSQREEFPAEAYDIVVTITDIDTYDSMPGRRPGAIAVRTTCNNSSEKRFHSVAIVRDRGDFEGLLTAAHALGTFLGAVDDSDPSDDCDTTEGFIMEPKKKLGPKNLKFSSCSLRRLSYSLRTTHINCFDKPAEFYPSGDPVQKLLPGDVRDADKQCQRRHYDAVCKSPKMCAQMQCYYTHELAAMGSYWCHNAGPAAEGTACASGHKCVEGICQCMTEDCLYIK